MTAIVLQSLVWAGAALCWLLVIFTAGAILNEGIKAFVERRSVAQIRDELWASKDRAEKAESAIKEMVKAGAKRRK